MASGQSAITPCSTDLLDVVFNTSRQVVVNDRLDITLVDSHGESDGTDENSGPVFDEVPLDEGPLFVSLAGVVGSGRDALLVQATGDLFTGASLSGKDKDRREPLVSVAPEEGHESISLGFITCNGQLEVDPSHVQLGH